MDANEILRRNNVRVIGDGPCTLVLAHGFGCDQNMWRFMAPLLDERYRLVFFDYVGSGNSSLAHFSLERYHRLEGYARDVIEVCEALALEEAVFVGHSVSATIGQLASLQRPALFSALAMICPSPCFLNDPPEYEGGFEAEDLEELMNLMDKNYIGWANYLAPLVMGSESSPAMVGELSGSFCSTDPVIAKSFARATFFADYRHLLPEVTLPSLIVQSERDTLANPVVGKYMHKHLPRSVYHEVPAEGHCLHMTRPEEVAAVLMRFIDNELCV